MSVTVGPSDADRYGWRGASEAALSTAAIRIARNLARSSARVVGFLPADARLDPAERLAPMLACLAEALTGFLGGDIAVIDAWRTWPWGEALQAGEAPAIRIRRLGARIVEIAPPPCADPVAAGMALEDALGRRPPDIARVLVNLGGYADAGTVPPAAQPCDGVVLVVAPRKTRKGPLAALRARIPPGKEMGAILVG